MVSNNLPNQIYQNVLDAVQQQSPQVKEDIVYYGDSLVVVTRLIDVVIAEINGNRRRKK